MQILVIGGGIQGLATAAELAREGHLVQVVERERPGSRASWVAAGLLTPSSPWKYPRGLIELCHASEAMYGDFVADLLEHTGIDPQYENAGMIYPEGVGFSAEQIAGDTRRRNELGFELRHLDRVELDAVQPGFGPAMTGAAWQPHSGRVRSPRLVAAVLRRALQCGVDVISEVAVAALVAVGGRVTGVRLETGQELEAECVVLAAGSWSGALAASLGLQIDVRPVRGQILLLRGPPGLLGPTVNDGDCYLVPRRDGRILVGSTMEDAGFDAVTTPEALARLRELAAQLLPATADMEVETDWAGLRPGTPDRLPYIGPVPELPGLVLATGHFRNGILLAPITARIVADVIAERTPCVGIAAYAPRPVDPDLTLLTR
jgi:glycine oxidase